MKILALESSATACSVALCEEEKLIAQSFQNNGLTHSRTLMPMLEHMLDSCASTLDEIDLIAVAAGPGSFTGLRIGVAAAKGLAWPAEKPCAGVSTLEAMAWTFRGTGEGLERLTPDRAIGLPELAAELKNRENPQILVGDGALLCYTTFKEQGLDVHLAPPHLRYQSAWGVARAALEQARIGALTDAQGLVPVYHRLSQAERERLERLRAEEAAEKTR